MAADVGCEADGLTFLESLRERPYRHDFYQALRRLEGLHREKPRWGCALRPREEPVRLGQEPDLTFAPAPLAGFDPGDASTPHRLRVRLFGLLGPNGPLPMHLTECVRDRLRHAGDAALARFLDVLQHRFITLLYRAWAAGQPHVNRDRPEDDRFAAYIGALIGIAPAAFQGRDSTSQEARLFHVGVLGRTVRNAEGLSQILVAVLGTTARVEEFVPHWMSLDTADRTRLGGSAALGRGAVLGARVWDRQHKFRIRLGPLTLAEYERLLPRGDRLAEVVDWVRLYFDCQLEWDLQLVLTSGEVPALRLGHGPRLGWTTWLGRRQTAAPAADLCYRPESVV